MAARHARSLDRRPGAGIHRADHHQRAYSAASKIITTADQMLQELLTIKQ
ncbi:MAG: flagellar basal body rod C-terminal domain-containing protein [Asticcacaulis sp.]